MPLRCSLLSIFLLYYYNISPQHPSREGLDGDIRAGEGGADGLDFYRAILRNFDAALRPGGTICFEFGFGQETALTELLQAAGYEDVTLRKDLRGVVRAVSAKKPEA